MQFDFVMRMIIYKIYIRLSNIKYKAEILKLLHLLKILQTTLPPYSIMQKETARKQARIIFKKISLRFSETEQSVSSAYNITNKSKFYTTLKLTFKRFSEHRKVINKQL